MLLTNLHIYLNANGFASEGLGQGWLVACDRGGSKPEPSGRPT